MNININPLAPTSFKTIPAGFSIRKIDALPAPLPAIPLDTFYFSKASTRAKIDRFLQGKGSAHLIFDFVANSDQQGQSSSHVALTLEHKRVKDAVLGKASRNKTAYRSDIIVKQMDYNPIVDGVLLAEAIKLNFQKLPLLKKGLAPNAVQLADGSILTKNRFKAQGIEKIKRDWVEPILTAINDFSKTDIGQYLSQKLSPLIRLENKESIVLLNQWRFNPSYFWQDKEGNAVKPLRLIKLANGSIGDSNSPEKKNTFIGTGKGLADISLKKLVKENVLSFIDEIEARGYSLVITAASEKPMPSAPLKNLGKMPRDNPFAKTPLVVSKITEEKKNPAT